MNVSASGSKQVASRSFAALVTLLLGACAPQDIVAPVVDSCDNDELTDFESLLILAPHPDDEVLGFAGLASAFANQGKPVRTNVGTDCDAYCVACALWTTGSIEGPACDAATLSNFETGTVDSLAEARRLESAAAAGILERPAPEFLGYPDTGLGFARAYANAGKPDQILRRSDFSACTDCLTCESGYGEGPATTLSANTLRVTLDEILAATSSTTLVATTHPLDGHGDHTALGSFVTERITELGLDRSVAFAVIHANTRNGYPHADCWYPGPATPECDCFNDLKADADADWLASLRRHRERPDWPQVLPEDVDYGEPSQFCLDDAMRSTKPLAIDAFKTQLGTIGQTPGILPASREGLLDCTAYLRSFGRRTEVFVVEHFTTDRTGMSPGGTR